MTLQLGCDIEGLGCPTFDTYANTDNATGEMYDWINNLPMGTVVAGGIVDEGTNGMTVLGHSALDMLGCSLSRSIKYREGYAFIGTKGDTQGAAVEDHGTATFDASAGAISANEKKCTDSTNSGNEYNPRPTRQLRRVYFKGQAGLPIDQEFGRRAGTCCNATIVAITVGIPSPFSRCFSISNVDLGLSTLLQSTSIFHPLV